MLPADSQILPANNNAQSASTLSTTINDLRPLRGWRYAPELAAEIDTYVSPLFDVVSARQREALYLNPLNSIHLSVPRGDDSGCC